MDPPISLEYGFSLGSHYQLSEKHSVGLWGGVGFGGVSMVFLSHFCVGLDYLYGDKVESWALGPVIGMDLANFGGVFGIGLFFKNWFIRTGFSLYPIDEGRNEYGFHVDLGYSFYFGK